MEKILKIIFFGTSNVALPVLEALLKEHQVLAVVSTPDAMVGRNQELSESPVSALAKDLKLNLLKPETVKNNQDFLQSLKNLGADIFVVVSYGKILPAEIINLPKYKTVNVHFSVLPKYRGASPMQAALQNGDKQTGISIFVLDESMDSGPLLAQEIVGIEDYDNFFLLADKLAKKSAELINPTLADYVSGKITPLPQDGQRASYCGHITKEDGKIDWQKSAQEIYNQFRAFYLWPGIWTTWNGKKLKITDCVPDPDMRIESDTVSRRVALSNDQGGSADDNKPGVVLSDGIVACGQNTFLKIKTLQLEGKNETDIVSFLNGYKDFVGSVLGN